MKTEYLVIIISSTIAFAAYQLTLYYLKKAAIYLIDHKDYDDLLEKADTCITYSRALMNLTIISGLVAFIQLILLIP